MSEARPREGGEATPRVRSRVHGPERRGRWARRDALAASALRRGAAAVAMIVAAVTLGVLAVQGGPVPESHPAPAGAAPDSVPHADARPATRASAPLPARALLTLTASVPTARIDVNGETVGHGALRALDVEASLLVIRVSAPGHDRVERIVQPTVDSHIDLGRIALEPWPKLEPAGIPRDATIRLGGAVVTEGQPIRPGPRSFTISRDGYEEQRLHLAVLRGRSVELRARGWRRTPWSLLSDLRTWSTSSSADRSHAAAAVAARVPGLEVTELQMHASGGARHEVAVFAHATSGLEFVLIPAGTFQMGSPRTEPARHANEPLHTVSLTRPFLICRTEVTNNAKVRLQAVADGQAELPPKPLWLMSIQVGWTDADRFCRDLGWTLPTEAQWEYACRAGTTSRFSCGSSERDLRRHAYTSISRASGRRLKLRPNAFGLYDMHGSLWEWCRDDYVDRPDWSASDPLTVRTSAGHVVRGGARTGSPESARSARRTNGEQDIGGHAFIGFRPVIEIAPFESGR